MYVETEEADTGFVYITNAENGKKDRYKIACTIPVSKSMFSPIAVVNASKNIKSSGIC
jgi:molybdate transport system substrate-binding protein